jgi:hypothetical protein
MPPPVAQATISLNPGQYQAGQQSFRNVIESLKTSSPPVVVKVVTPTNVDLFVKVRVADLYVVAFYGDKWYTFDGEDKAYGESCGVGSNYAQLGRVGEVSLDDLKALGALAGFSKGTKVDTRLLAILFAVVSEAARFATISTYFTGITNGLLGTMNFEEMKERYFNNWTKPPDESTFEIGKIYHYTKHDILVPRNR